MSERDFEIGGRKFKLNKIDAFKQFHIVRRIGPILADLIPAMKNVQQISGKAELSESEKLDQFAALAAPFMTGLSKLSDADSELVLFGLLSSVEVNANGAWAKVATSSMLMMQDMELPILLQVAGRAFMFNLSGFFAALPRQS
jgi:hypothetical protein